MKYEKQRISSAALHRISCSRVGSLSSVALFRCIFSFGTFFGFIRVYTVVFSDPNVRRLVCLLAKPRTTTLETLLAVDFLINIDYISRFCILGSAERDKLIERIVYVSERYNVSLAKVVNFVKYQVYMGQQLDIALVEAENLLTNQSQKEEDT